MSCLREAHLQEKSKRKRSEAGTVVESRGKGIHSHSSIQGAGGGGVGGKPEAQKKILLTGQIRNPS